VAINSIETIKNLKQKYPHLYGHVDDETILNHLKKKYSHLDWGVEEPQVPPPTTETIEDIDPPGVMSKIMSWSATDSLADDYDWAKRAYNNSTAGAIYKIMNGEAKYKVEDMPNEWYQDAAGFFLGMTNPIEALTFIGTAGAGSVAGKLASNKLFGEATKRGLLKAGGAKAKDKVFKNRLMKEAATTGALSLGGFSAAAGTIHRYGEQAVEIQDGKRDDYDHWEITKGAGEDFFHGAVLGAAGGIVTSPMATKFARASRKVDAYKRKGIEVPSSLAASKIMNSPFGQILAESQVFTAGQVSEQAILNGEMPSADDWWKGTFSNLAIIGGLKTGSKIYKKAFTKDTSTDIENYYKSKKKLFQDAYENKIFEGIDKKRQAELEAFESTKKSIEENGGIVPEEILNRITEIEMEAVNRTVEAKDVRKGMKRIDELKEKATNENNELDLLRLTEAERGEFGQLNTSMNLWMVDFYDSLQNNPEIAREWYRNKISTKEKPVTELSEAQEKTMNNIIGAKLDSHLKVSELFNSAVKQENIKEIKTKEDVDKALRELSDKIEKDIVTPEKITQKPLFDESLTIKEQVKQLRVEAENRGISIEQVETYKGKAEKVPGELGLFPSNNPEGWDVSGLNRFLLAKDVKGKTLSQKVSEVNPEKLPESFNKVVGKKKETLKDYINNQDFLTEQDKAMAIIGFRDHFIPHGTYNSPAPMRRLVDYFNFLRKNGRGVDEATSKLTNEFMNTKDWQQGTRDAFKNAVSAFYGSGSDAQRQHITDGFAYRYMQRDGRTPTIAESVRLSAMETAKKKAPLKSREDWNKIDEVKKANTKDIANTSPQNVDAVLDFLYNFGRRSVDILKRLKVKDINEDGSINISIGKKAVKGKEIKSLIENFNEVLPEFYKKLIQLKKGKGENDLVISKKDGKPLTNANVNKIIKEIFNEAGAEVLSKGGKEIPTSHDFRRTLQNDATTLGGGFKELASLLTGEKPQIRERYFSAENIDLWKKFVKERGKSDKKEKRTGRLPEEVRFKEGDAKARETFSKEVMKKNNLNESQLKEVGLDKNVLGEWADGIIKLAKGEFQPADFFHENMHRLKDFANITNNKKLQKLINQGERLAKGTKEYQDWLKVGDNKKRGKSKAENIEEFLADIVGGKADRIQFTKGMLPKLKQVINKIASQLKVAFGMGNFKDYSNVLAAKVEKGFKTEGVKFGKEVKQRIVGEIPVEEVKLIAKNINNNIKLKLEDIDATSIKDRQGIINHIAQAAEIIKDGEKFQILPRKGIPEGVSPTEYYQQLKKFESTLEGMNIEKIKRVKDVNKWFDTYKQVELMRVNEKGLTESSRKKMLKALGVPEGDIWRASQKQIDNYKEMLHTIRGQETFNPDFIDMDIMAKKVDPKYLTGWEKFKVEGKRATYPVYKVLEAMGLRPLSKLMKKHFGVEAGHLGNYDNMVVDFKKGWTAPDGKQMKGLGEGGWNKIKDSMAIALSGKGERYIENMDMLRKNRELLSKKEIKNIEASDRFFKKAIKKEWFKEGGDLKDFINKDTVEGRIAERYVEYTKYYPKIFDEIAQILMNPAQYEKFKKEGNVKFIEDGVFITQQTTTDFKKLVGLEHKSIEGIVDKSTNQIAIDLAKELYKTKNPTMEQIGSQRDVAKGMAYEQLYDASTFSLDKVSSKFLLKRHDKLPEFVKNPDDGKLIRVYETSHDATVMKYSIGMAKFLATLEVFPEFAKMKGFKKSGAKKLIGQLQQSDPQAFEWVNQSFERRIGVGQSNPFEMTVGISQKFANVLAKVGLSSPTSGIKNIITGTAGTAYAFELQDIARGFSGVIKGEAKELVKTGAHQIGTAHFEEGKISETLDKTFFRAGWMKPTEKFNRNLVQMASKYDQARMIEAMRVNKKGSAKYERAKDRLEDFYELSSSDIALMVKHGFESNVINKANFNSTRDYLIEKRNLDNAIQRAYTMSHVKTQGASIDLFMPSFASGNMIKPLTLYKRMAFAATVNTAENIRRAYKSKDYGKILVGTLATYTGGAALMGMYSGLFGQAMPKENDSFWSRQATIMWKGEMLGLFSEFFSPFSSSINSSLYPAIYTNAGALAQGFSDVIQDKKFVFGKGQAFDTYARKTLSIYNAGMKIIEKRNNPYNRDMIRMSNLWKNYNEDVLEKPVQMFEGTELTKYKIDLKNAFNLGTEEEFVRTYMTLRFALAGDYMKKGFAEGKNKDIIYHIKGNPDRAFKAADAKLKTMMTNLNPNPASIRKGQAIETKLTRADFIDWIVRNDPQDKRQIVKRMNELENEYKDKMKSINKSFGYYLRKMNMKELAKEAKFNL